MTLHPDDIEYFEQLWPHVPKGELIISQSERDQAVMLFVTVEHLCVYMDLTVGAHGGIVQTVIAIDPLPRIVVDRLVAAFSTRSVRNQEVFIDLMDARTAVRKVPRKDRKELALRLCRQMLEGFLSEVKAGLPASRFYNLTFETNISIRPVSGGLPSTGRNGGGAGGGY